LHVAAYIEETVPLVVGNAKMDAAEGSSWFGVETKNQGPKPYTKPPNSEISPPTA
jgi:hypothetical protein